MAGNEAAVRRPVRLNNWIKEKDRMNGEEKIRNYIDRAFSSSAQTEKVLEAKEALCADLLEKYQALITEGNTPEAAYQATISSIGDIFELVDSVTEGSSQLALSKDESPSLEPSSKWGQSIPFILVGVFLLFWVGSEIFPHHPKLDRILPVLLVGVVIVAIYFMHSKGIVLQNPSDKKIWPILIVWCIAGILFLAAIMSPRFQRVLWLIPVAALAIHQIISAWMCYNTSEKRGNPHE